MKALFRFCSILLFSALLFQCSDDEEVAPQTPNDPGTPADTTDVVSGSGAEADNFYFAADTVSHNELETSLEGQLLVETEEGEKASLADGEFTVVKNAEGQIDFIEGSGRFEMPDAGLFGNINTSQTPEGYFMYNTGKHFKDNNDDFARLPLADSSYYFYFNALNLAKGEDFVFTIDQAEIGVTSFFLNMPREEFVCATGKFKIETPSGPVELGSAIDIGISGKGTFAFVPQTFEDSALNAEIANKKAFENIEGNLYLKGEISLGKKIPMAIDGSAIIGANLRELFSGGFDEAKYVMGMNGILKFGHDLIDLLPVNVDAEMTNATMKFEQTTGGSGIKASYQFAGQFDDNVWIEALMGETVSQYVPLTGNKGFAFASFGDDVDWEMFVNLGFDANFPFMGKQDMRNGTLRINSEFIEVSGSLGVPFHIGEISASGHIAYDGDFRLSGRAVGKVEPAKGLRFESDFQVDISNDSAALDGFVVVPHGIGKVDVEGKIDENGLYFKGLVNSQIDFGNGVTLPAANMHLIASNSGVALGGSLQVNGAMPFVEVSGSITSQGIGFTGMINSNMMFGSAANQIELPAVNLHLLASSTSGVQFNGMLEIPYGIGKVQVYGGVTPRKDHYGLPEITFNAAAQSNVKFTVSGYDFLAAKMTIKASTIDGVEFSGSVGVGQGLGFASVSGGISATELWFNGSIKQNVGFGPVHVLYADLNIEASSNSYPNIASVTGKIDTPFGFKVDVSGVVGLNKKFRFTGSHNFKSKKIPVVNDYLRAGASFTFSQDGISTSGYGQKCEDENGNVCEGISVDLDFNWSEKSVNVCLPLPFVPCFGI